MKKHLSRTFGFVALAFLTACVPSSKSCPPHVCKTIYIPEDLQKMNLQDTASQWSYARMDTTDNFVIFWEKGFGPDLSKAPQLEGHSMTVDLANLEEKLERFYRYYRDTMAFVLPGSLSEQYRMMVMINYSLEGTAYGGDYDQKIGALWVAPNRIQDRKLNCIAHELGHSFQSQIVCDGQGECWGGSGFFEMASQWMLWQVNTDWVTSEKYHWDAFRTLTHKAFLHMENIYHSPYILEYWSSLHGPTVIADLFRAGKKGEDPVMTYKQLYTANDQGKLNQEMFEACRRIALGDLPRVRKELEPYTHYTSKLEDAGEGWWRIAPKNCPENYGFNVIPVTIPDEGTTVSVEFAGEAGRNGYAAVQTDKAGWRYGWAALAADGETFYSEQENETEGTASFTIPKGSTIAALKLIVMGAPTEHWTNPWQGPDAQWPYRIKFTNATLLNK